MDWKTWITWGVRLWSMFHGVESTKTFQVGEFRHITVLFQIDTWAWIENQGTLKTRLTGHFQKPSRFKIFDSCYQRPVNMLPLTASLHAVWSVFPLGSHVELLLLSSKTLGKKHWDPKHHWRCRLGGVSGEMPWMFWAPWKSWRCGNRWEPLGKLEVVIGYHMVSWCLMMSNHEVTHRTWNWIQHILGCISRIY